MTLIYVRNHDDKAKELKYDKKCGILIYVNSFNGIVYKKDVDIW